VSWQDLVDRANAAFIDAFAAGACTYTPKDGSQPIQISTVPMDPLRLGEESPGQFTVRWARSLDFGAIVPVRGDSITLPDGGSYAVEQVQAESTGGVRLVLAKKP
jgi:hypothetical protein